MSAYDLPTFRRLLATGATRRGLLQGAAAVGLAAPVLGTTSASVARVQADATSLIIGLDGAPSDRDPHSQYDYRSTTVVRGVYEGLIALKGSSTEEYEGLIAESWAPNEDRSVWTFKIRPGVTFHNGDSCDAAAVKASYERLLAMNLGAVGVFSRFVADPAQMTVPDPQTIVFDCGKPSPLFEAAMAATTGPQVVNVNVAKANEEDGDYGNAWMRLNSEGAGTGPYVVTEYDPSTGVVLERNETYWGGWDGPHLDRVIFRIVEEVQTLRQLLEAGEIDIIDKYGLALDSLAELETNPELRIDVQDSTEVEYFTMTEAGPLASPGARQALCYAFPYQEVLDGVYLGYASRANTPLAPSIRGFDPGSFFFETDLDRARELLASAGVAEGAELTMLLISSAPTAISELFQANLAEIGVTLTIERVDQSTFTAVFYGDTPAEERPSLMGWSWWPDYNDAWNNLYPITSCDAWGSKGGNGGFYCNEEYEALLAEAKDAATEVSYDEVLSRAQAIIAEQDVPAICYAQPQWITALNRRVEGFVFNPIYLGTYDLHKMSKA